MTLSGTSGRLPTPIGTIGKGWGTMSDLLDSSVWTQLTGRIVGARLFRPNSPTSGIRPPSKGSGPSSFADMIKAAAQREGLDTQLVKAVVETESGFNPNAVSHAGAKGLMQLMDGTAKSLGVKDPFDPASNLAGGTKFLRSLLDRFHSVPLALAAYNAGPAAVEKYGGLPPYQETRNYVERVLALEHRDQLAAADGSDEGGDNGRGTTA